MREYLDMRKNSYLLLVKTPSYNKATTDKNPYFYEKSKKMVNILLY